MPRLLGRSRQGLESAESRVGRLAQTTIGKKRKSRDCSWNRNRIPAPSPVGVGRGYSRRSYFLRGETEPGASTGGVADQEVQPVHSTTAASHAFQSSLVWSLNFTGSVPRPPGSANRPSAATSEATFCRAVRRSVGRRRGRGRLAPLSSSRFEHASRCVGYCRPKVSTVRDDSGSTCRGPFSSERCVQD
jgi:hypothetical protein